MSVNHDRLVSLITHDLRNGLNAVHMSLHMIESELPADHPELATDFQMLQESVSNLRRMLDYLTAYAQLFEAEADASSTIVTSSTRRLLDDAAADVPEEIGGPDRIRIVVEPGAPEEIALDPRRAHVALRYAMANALVASEGGTVMVTSRGGRGRWIVTIHDPSPLAVDGPAVDLEPGKMERILSNRRERRGIDLAIAAGVSALFGGTARLQAHSDGGTELILDWPTAQASA